MAGQDYRSPTAVENRWLNSIDLRQNFRDFPLLAGVQWEQQLVELSSGQRDHLP